MGNAAAIREDCCDAGEIAQANPKYFKKPTVDEGWQDDANAEKDEENEFEHIGAGVHRATREHAQTRRSAAASSSRSKRGRQGGAAKGKRRPAGFDHEASFAEAASGKQGRSSSSTGAPARDRDPELVRAIKRGKFEELDGILRQLPSAVNEQDKFEQTPIFYISALGHMQALQTLLAYDAEVQCANKFGYTPLMRALRHGQVQVAGELLRRRADIMTEDSHRATTLQIASTAGKADSVEWVLRQKGASRLLQHRDSEGVTPLLAAVTRGNADVCRLLLEARARPGVSDEQGRSPLLLALARSDVDLAHSLIDAQADVNAEDEDGRTVLRLLVDNLVRFKDQKEVHEHTLCGLATALEAKADPDIVSEKGETALCVAVKHNDPVLCAILAAFGADAGITDGAERSLISYAKKKGLVDVEKVLSEFGAVRTKKSPALNRTLLRAVYYGHAEACKGLLDRGAEHNYTSKGGLKMVDLAKKVSSTTAYKVLKDVIDAEKHHHGGQQHMKDEEKLAKWLNVLQETGHCCARMQRAVREQHPDAVVTAVQELMGCKIPDDDATVSAVFLSRFVRQRRAMTLTKAHTELRRLRARMRRQLLTNMARDVEVWDQGLTQENSRLHTIITLGMAAVQKVKPSEFELTDSYANKLDAVQVEALRKPLKICAAFSPLWAEVCAAYEAFPSADLGAVEIDDLQCPRCFLAFATEGARNEHAKHCRSNLGVDEEEKRRMRRQAKAESAIHRLKRVDQMLRKKAGDCEVVVEELKAQRKEIESKMPEAVATLQGLYTMLQSLRNVFVHRAKCLHDYIHEANEMHGLLGENGTPTEEKVAHQFCLRCFVQPVTRAVKHAEGEMCKCVCSACAFEVSVDIKRGRTPVCPDCGELVLDFAVVTGVAVT